MEIYSAGLLVALHFYTTIQILSDTTFNIE